MVVFERATIADAAALTAVQIAAFEHDAVLYPGIEPGGPPGYDSVADMRQRIEQAETYKMVLDGRCIGGLVVFDMGLQHYHLGVIFIDPACHNRGIGTQAMRFIEQTFPAARWTLDTPQWATRNHHFYEKLGYVRTGEIHIEGDDTLLYAYEKRIASGP